MILVYPMLTSKSVSSNITPGICKLLERYLLVYSMDTLLKSAGILNAPKAASAAARTFLNARENTLNEMPQGQPQPNQKKQYQPPNININIPPQQTTPKDSGMNKTEIGVPKDSWNTVSIEPTWFTIKGGVFGDEKMIGVKVVPFPVTSASNVVDAIMKDKASSSFEYIYRKYSRMIGRILFMFLRKLKTPGITSSLSGNPTNDILFAKTGYGGNIFLCLNKLDFNESSIIDNPRGIGKLISMGWNSIIVTDDVNKEATFCMEQFGGLCSTTPYGFIYSTLGKDHSKVFSDISDIKKSSAPFFHKATRMSSVVSEAVAARKMSDMLIKRKKREVIVEDVDSFINVHKSNILNKIKEIKSGIDKGDLNAVRLATVDIPKAPVDNFVREKAVHDNYNYVKRVLKNSLNIGDSAIHHMSALISVGASTTENPIETTKESIKHFVRKLSNKTGIEFIKAFLAAAWVFIIGVMGKRGIDAFRKTLSATSSLSIKSVLGALSNVSLSSVATELWGFATKNWYLFLILLVIYIIADFVKHEGDLQDEQQ